ncbi:MAG: XRE family transcriptional regulator [Atopobiaceae bacterium]|nr:XRE family transcriptional regulator [Atopobiaceae bacterium]
MEERLTEELLDELLSSPDPASYIDQHRPNRRDFTQYINELAAARGLERKEVIAAAQLDSTYGYMLFSGKRRHPSRDIVLQFAFGMHLSLLETDRLLQAAGASKLYCKDRRDAIVIFCLDRQTSLDEANEALFRLGERTLGEDKQGKR